VRSARRGLSAIYGLVRAPPPDHRSRRPCHPWPCAYAASGSGSASGHGAHSRRHSGHLGLNGPYQWRDQRSAVFPGVGSGEAVERVDLRRLRALGVRQRCPVAANVLRMTQGKATPPALLIGMAEIPPRGGMDRTTTTPTHHPASPHPRTPAPPLRPMDRAIRMLAISVAFSAHLALSRHDFLNRGGISVRARSRAKKLSKKPQLTRPSARVCRVRWSLACRRRGQGVG
jgi:hypothetical protein